MQLASVPKLLTCSALQQMNYDKDLVVILAPTLNANTR